MLHNIVFERGIYIEEFLLKLNITNAIIFRIVQLNPESSPQRGVAIAELYLGGIHHNEMGSNSNGFIFPHPVASCKGGRPIIRVWFKVGHPRLVCSSRPIPLRKATPTKSPCRNDSHSRTVNSTFSHVDAFTHNPFRSLRNTWRTSASAQKSPIKLAAFLLKLLELKLPTTPLQTYLTPARINSLLVFFSSLDDMFYRHSCEMLRKHWCLNFFG